MSCVNKKRCLEHRLGYLMIEFLVALAAMMMFSLFLGLLQAHAVAMHRQSYNYLAALTLIDATFEALQRGQAAPVDKNIALSVNKKDTEKKNLILVTVEARWQERNNKKRAITIEGIITKPLPTKESYAA